MLVADRDGAALLSLAGIGSAPEGHDYEAWVVPPGSATPQPAGTFDGTELFYRAWFPTMPATRGLILLHRGHEHSGRFAEFVEAVRRVTGGESA